MLTRTIITYDTVVVPSYRLLLHHVYIYYIYIILYIYILYYILYYIILYILYMIYYIYYIYKIISKEIISGVDTLNMSQNPHNKGALFGSHIGQQWLDPSSPCWGKLLYNISQKMYPVKISFNCFTWWCSLVCHVLWIFMVPSGNLT